MYKNLETTWPAPGSLSVRETSMGTAATNVNNNVKRTQEIFAQLLLMTEMPSSAGWDL